MIVAKVEQRLLVVLEPGNVDKIQIGQPVKIDLKEYFPVLPDGAELAIAFTPDILWVMEEVKKGRSFIQVLEESLMRPEVHSRPHHEVEKRDDIKI